jgi:hypothetical protein
LAGAKLLAQTHKHKHFLRSSPGMPLGFLVFAGSVARDREKEKEKAAHVECIMSDSSGPPPLVSDSEEDWGPGPRVRQDDSETSSEDSDPRPWASNAQLRSSSGPWASNAQLRSLGGFERPAPVQSSSATAPQKAHPSNGGQSAQRDQQQQEQDQKKVAVAPTRKTKADQKTRRLRQKENEKKRLLAGQPEERTKNLEEGPNGYGKLETKSEEAIARKSDGDSDHATETRSTATSTTAAPCP